MKRKLSEKTFSQILQEIKEILPKRFTCKTITNLEQSEGLESATIKNMTEVLHQLTNLKNLLPLRYWGTELREHKQNIEEKIQEIKTIIPLKKHHSSTTQRLSSCAAETSDKEEDDEKIDSDAENTPPSNSQNDNNIESDTQPYTYQTEGSLASTQSLSVESHTPPEDTQTLGDTPLVE